MPLLLTPLTHRMNLATFGLPKCMHIPIAAASVEVLESSVGTVLARRVSRRGRTNAVLPASHIRPTKRLFPQLSSRLTSGTLGP